LTTDSPHSRAAYLDSVRSLLLLHPAGYTDGMKHVPTFQKPGEEFSRDYSGGVLRLADVTPGYTLIILLSKAHSALAELQSTSAHSDDRHALLGSLLLRPEVMQAGIGPGLSLRHPYAKIDTDLGLGCCFAGMLLPACEENFGFYADSLLEEKPQLVGEVIDRALSGRASSTVDEKHLLSQIGSFPYYSCCSYNLLSDYIDRQFSYLDERDNFRNLPLVQRALNSKQLTELTRLEREELAGL